jgi:predicted enzyme related to lactoylglutathione lyase
MTSMLRGLTTITFHADDVAAAQRWYEDLLGIKAYFVRPEVGPPAYVEFRIGDDEDELGIMDRRYGPAGAGGPGGAVAYWHVDDLEATLATLRAAGATDHEPITERGPGFVTASVVDPFGNLLGIMYNAHYLERHA